MVPNKVILLPRFLGGSWRGCRYSLPVGNPEIFHVQGGANLRQRKKILEISLQLEKRTKYARGGLDMSLPSCLTGFTGSVSSYIRRGSE